MVNLALPYVTLWIAITALCWAVQALWHQHQERARAARLLRYWRVGDAEQNTWGKHLNESFDV